MTLFLTLFLFGLAVGSFLNVVASRYKPEKSVFDWKQYGGRSKCPHCRKTLGWFELIPLVSFFIQKRRCRGCGHEISWQYPLIELTIGLIFVGVPIYLKTFYGATIVSAAGVLFYLLAAIWILVFSIWLLISVIDKRYYIIPDELNILIAVLGVALVAVKSSISDLILPFHTSFLQNYILLFSPAGSIWLNHLLGAFAGGLFFVFLILVSRGLAMGWGDVKLGFASGLVLGWPDMGLSLMLAFILGGALGGLLLLRGKKKMKDRLPFGPFLIAGMVITFFFGHEILSGYFGLFGI